MKISVVINRAAGGIRADSETRIRQLMRSAGHHHMSMVDFDGARPELQLRRLAAENPDFLVVWGGDGTHRSALNALGRKPSNLVLLPGGTRNLLTRSLHGTAAWERILPSVLAAPRERVLPAGQIGDQLFFCAMLAGMPALFAEARESLRDGDLGRALDEAGQGLNAVQDLRLAASYGQNTSVATDRLHPTSLIGALVGFLAKNSRMEIVALDKPTMFPALDVIWTSFYSGFRNIPGVSIIPAETLVIEDEGGADIPAIADGEPLSMGSRIQVSFVECGGYCLTAS